MGILQNASKTLLVVTLVIAPATADDNHSFPSTSSEVPRLVGPNSLQPKAAGRTGKQRAGSAERATSVTRQRPSSGRLFFPPSRSALAPSVLTDDSSSDSERQRMPVTSMPAGDVSHQPNSAPVPSPDPAATDTESVIRAAVAESVEDVLPVFRQVAAEGDDPFLDFAEVEETQNLSFDEGDLPDLPIPDFSTDSGIQSDDDSQRQPIEAEFSFEPNPSEFDVGDLPSAESFETDEMSGVAAVPETDDGSLPLQHAVPNTPGDNLPSLHTGAQRPSVEVEWTRYGTLNIGQKSQCSLVVTNTGGSVVRNVTVEAAVPNGVDVVSAVPVPQPGTSRWSVGDLAAGESRSIDMVMIPRQRGDVALNAFVRFTGYATSVVSVEEPMLRTIVEGPESVTVGEHAGYKVRVENPGTGTAHNVVIEAQIPEGMQHRSGSGRLKIHVGTLNAGESRQALLNLTALDGGKYRLAVRAIADGGLSDEARTNISISKPSLDVAISGPDASAVGKPSDYEVTVTNTGNIPSINVLAKYRLPENARFVQADRGGVHQESERLIDWFVGTIQPGESASYHITMELGSPGIALHRAGVKSEHTGIMMVSHSTTVRGVPELFLDVATAEPAPAVGEETVVRIVVQNEGNFDAGKVGLICELPSGFEFVAAEGPSDFLAENGVVIFRSIEAVQAGGEATYLITGRCVRAGSHRVRVRVGSPSLSEPVIGEGTVKTRDAR